MIDEAIEHKFKLVMIRPNYVKLAKELLKNHEYVTVGTVISFPEVSKVNSFGI